VTQCGGTRAHLFRQHCDLVTSSSSALDQRTVDLLAHPPSRGNPDDVLRIEHVLRQLHRPHVIGALGKMGNFLRIPFYFVSFTIGQNVSRYNEKDPHNRVPVIVRIFVRSYTTYNRHHFPKLPVGSIAAGLPQHLGIFGV
jgi:hypothetical protein